jgi:hypothetical protein
VSGPSPETSRLLNRVRVVAAIVTLCLLVFAVIVERDPTTLGMLIGALALWIGLSAPDWLRP